jgi:hypothetical protein
VRVGRAGVAEMEAIASAGGAPDLMPPPQRGRNRLQREVRGATELIVERGKRRSSILFYLAAEGWPDRVR